MNSTSTSHWTFLLLLAFLPFVPAKLQTVQAQSPTQGHRLYIVMDNRAPAVGAKVQVWDRWNSFGGGWIIRDEFLPAGAPVFTGTADAAGKIDFPVAILGRSLFIHASSQGAHGTVNWQPSRFEPEAKKHSAKRFQMTLNRERTITVSVANKDGIPIADAMVYAYHQRNMAPSGGEQKIFHNAAFVPTNRTGRAKLIIARIYPLNEEDSITVGVLNPGGKVIEQKVSRNKAEGKVHLVIENSTAIDFQVADAGSLAKLAIPFLTPQMDLPWTPKELRSDFKGTAAEKAAVEAKLGMVTPIVLNIQGGRRIAGFAPDFKGDMKLEVTGFSPRVCAIDATKSAKALPVGDALARFNFKLNDHKGNQIALSDLAVKVQYADEKTPTEAKKPLFEAGHHRDIFMDKDGNISLWIYPNRKGQVTFRAEDPMAKMAAMDSVAPPKPWRPQLTLDFADLKPGSTTDKGELKLAADPLRIAGQVVDHRGKPMSGLGMQVRFDNIPGSGKRDGGVQIKTDKNGMFEWREYNDDKEFAIMVRHFRSPAKEIMVKNNDHKIVIKLRPPSYLNGRVKLANTDKPFYIMAFFNVDNHAFTERIVANRDFTIEVPAGAITMQLRIDGFLAGRFDNLEIPVGETASPEVLKSTTIAKELYPCKITIQSVTGGPVPYSHLYRTVAGKIRMFSRDKKHPIYHDELNQLEPLVDPATELPEDKKIELARRYHELKSVVEFLAPKDTKVDFQIASWDKQGRPTKRDFSASKFPVVWTVQ